MKTGVQAPAEGRDAYASNASMGGQEGISPLYKRLPHGPHRLDREQVALHQRARIHGAMVEAVARNGYEATSVKQVIGLAGVSRRSFYELFSNKQECFLATFDLIARREIQKIRRVYLSTDGALEDRLQAVFEACAEVARTERNASLLVLFDAQTAGAAGTFRMCRASAVCEQLLAACFVDSPTASPLPTPILRGIAGGMHGAVTAKLRREPVESSQELAHELLRWMMVFQSPSTEAMAEQLTKRMKARMREIAFAHAERPSATATTASASSLQAQDARSRLLESALRLATRHEQKELTAPQIADEARLTIDTFFELFETKEECFLAALDMVSQQLLAVAADPGLDGPDWPYAVRRAIAAMLSHLAEHPLHARVLVQDSYSAGEHALESNLELIDTLAEILTRGAPRPASDWLLRDGVTGALWHTVRCQVADGRIQLLPALADHVTYVVLAPFIGAEAAAEILTESPPAA